MQALLVAGACDPDRMLSTLSSAGEVCLRLPKWSQVSMTDEFLTLPEVALLLKVADKTVYSLAQRGTLPGFKVGGQWRFKRSDLDAWVEEQKTASRLASDEPPGSSR